MHPTIPGQRTHIAYESIALNITLPEGIEVDDLMRYIDVWRSCCTAVTDEQSHKLLVTERAKHLCTRKSSQVHAAAKAGSAADLVDLGIR